MAKRSQINRRGLAAVFVAAGMIAGYAKGGTAYWDVNQSNAGAGGPAATGAWDAGTPNWNPVLDGTGVVAPWNPGDTAVFSAGTDATGGFNVTVSGTQSAAGLTFEEGTVTLAGGEIDFSPSGALNVSAGVTGTVGTTIIGGTSLMVTGPGTLRLNNSSTASNNKFTGGISVNGGTLSFPGEQSATVGAVNALGAYPIAAVANYITLSNGAVLKNTIASGTSFLLANRGVTLGTGGGTFDNTANLTYAGIITGSGRLTKTGPGTLVLTAQNTFTGGTTISGGIISFVGNGNPNALGPTPGAPVANDIILDGGELLDTNRATATAGTFIGTNHGIQLTANGGKLGVLDTGNHTSFAALQYSGTIQLVPGVTDATLYKEGDGDLRATATNWMQTHLQLDGGRFYITGAGNETSFGQSNIFRADSIIANGAGPDRFTGGVSIGFANNLTTPANRGITINANGLTICPVSGRAWIINSVITGVGGLAIGDNGWVNGDNGTVTLNGVNTFLGPVQVNDGVLNLNNGAAIADTVAVTIASLSSNGSGTSATLVVNNSETIGSLAGGGGLLNGNVYGKVTLTARLTTGANNNSTTFSGVMAGGGSLEKVGTGLFALAGENAYISGTVITAGTLQIGAGGTSGSILTDVDDESILAFNRSDVSQFDHSISGGGSVVQTGTGTTQLTQDNSYSGGTTITHGTLQIGNGGGGSIQGDVTNNSVLAFGRGDDNTFGNLITGTGSVVQRSNATTTLSNANTYTGNTSVTSGTLSVSSDANLGNTTVAADVVLNGGTLRSTSTFSTNRTITVGTNNGTTNVDGGQVFTTTKAINGSGTLTNIGSGTLVAKTLTLGGISVSAGTVQLAQNGSVAAVVPNVTVAGGTLDLYDNDLVVAYTDTSPAPTIAAYLQSGFNGGTWDGVGIASTAAHNNSNASTGLGMAEASLLGITDIDGVHIDGQAVIVKYTYDGDSTLDGKVDLGNDFNLFLQGFLHIGGTGWVFGDYNYDSNTDSTDFSMFVDGFATQGGNLGDLENIIEGTGMLSMSQKASLLAVVPEPSSAMVLAIGAAGLVSRRRRKN